MHFIIFFFPKLVRLITKHAIIDVNMNKFFNIFIYQVGPVRPSFLCFGFDRKFGEMNKQNEQPGLVLLSTRTQECLFQHLEMFIQ